MRLLGLPPWMTPVTLVQPDGSVGSEADGTAAKSSARSLGCQPLGRLIELTPAEPLLAAPTKAMATT